MVRNVLTRRELLKSATVVVLGELERKLIPFAFGVDRIPSNRVISGEEVYRREEELRGLLGHSNFVYDHDGSNAKGKFADIHASTNRLSHLLLEQFVHAAVYDCDPSFLQRLNPKYASYTNPDFGVENRKDVISELLRNVKWMEQFSSYLILSAQRKIRAVDELAAATIQTDGFGIEGNSILCVFDRAFEKYQTEFRYSRAPHETVSKITLDVPYSRKRLEGLMGHEEVHRHVLAHGIPYGNGSMITRLNYLNFHPDVIKLVTELRGYIQEVEIIRPPSKNLKDSNIEELPQEYVATVVRFVEELRKYSKLMLQQLSREEIKCVTAHLNDVEKKVPELLHFKSIESFYNSWKSIQTSSL